MDEATFEQLMGRYDQAKSDPDGLDAETTRMVELLESYQNTLRIIFGMIRMDEIIRLSDELIWELTYLDLYKELTVLLTLSGNAESAVSVARRRIEELDLVPDPIIQLNDALKKFADVIRHLATMFDNLKACDRALGNLCQSYQRSPVSFHIFSMAVDNGIVNPFWLDAEFLAGVRPIFFIYQETLKKMKYVLDTDEHPELLGEPISDHAVETAVVILREYGLVPDLS